MAKIALIVVLLSRIALSSSTERSVRTVVGVTDYPLGAASAAVQGSVRLTCSLSDDGKVSLCKVQRGHQLLARQAIENAQSWRFDSKKPGASSEVKLIYIYSFTGVYTRDKPKVTFSFTFPNIINITSDIPCIDHAPCSADKQSHRSESKP